MLIGSLAVAWLSWPAGAGALPEIEGVRFGLDGRRTRVVVDVDQAVAFAAMAETDPPRLVLELPEVVWRPRADPMSRPRGLADAYHHDAPKPGLTRLIVDARARFRIARQFVLEPSTAAPHHRLVVDIEALGPPVMGSSSVEPVSKPSVLQHGTALPAAVQQPEPLVATSPLVRQWTVVLDPGHGGADPGAIGIDGSFEKTLTLRMARELRDLLETEGRYRVILTRDKDARVPLRKRVATARAAGADVFISLHADSLPGATRRGLSVFILSDKAASEEEARLAARTDVAAGDILSSVDLSHYDASVASILLDLAQRDTTNRSLTFANGLVDELGKVTPLMPWPRRFAGFAVLTSPDTPSVLIELGFLSNRKDAHALAGRHHRLQLANAIRRALDRYFTSLQP